MGRRIRFLGALMMICFALIVVQLINLQLVKAPSLADSPYNPREFTLKDNNDRGTIYAADGTVLAKSIPTPAGTTGYPYHFTRTYPAGEVSPSQNIYAGVLGYDSPLYYGTAGIEEEYNSYLSEKTPPPSNLSQLLFREKPSPVTDDVTLTLVPKLQTAAWDALTTLPPGAKKDGAVVVLDPQTGAVEAMVSNPTYNPNLMASTDLHTEQLAYFSYVQKDDEDQEPLRPLATGQFYAPGSTFKVITSTATYNLKPSLANFDYPYQACQNFPDGGKSLCDQSGPCGGTMATMLPQSCDPGYGELGVQLGSATLQQQAQLFGFGSVPGIDLPGAGLDVIASQFPGLGIPGLANVPGNESVIAYSAIGQENVKETALQNAMVASAIANGGVIMTPHLMSQITDSQGNVVERYNPTAMPRTASTKAAEQVTTLMEGVVRSGTADHVGFPAYLCAAVKTGTAQTNATQNVNTDWMIGFAPAYHPVVAVAVEVPEQNVSSDGAGVAGPIMNKVLQAAVPLGSPALATGKCSY